MMVVCLRSRDCFIKAFYWLLSFYRYLLKHGANVAAVNNDGDLAIDIAEDEDKEMKHLLQEEMEKKGMEALLTLGIMLCRRIFYCECEVTSID